MEYLDIRYTPKKNSQTSSFPNSLKFPSRRPNNAIKYTTIINNKILPIMRNHLRFHGGFDEDDKNRL